ncbi:radical SAM/SPASM protein FxsBH, inactivated beta-hydroxylase extension form [Streptomyces sp. AK02-01A]|uniref:radical SAM/SPASM protein FxsBH, inactivated beta-hydroxylase extension form n=1 Tax=Streptomyces sp. AK02-01A TaxID=3028648 RepID=UPI0029A40F54|nr:radical SAM/SPASM protein FxsB, inactivated metallohydrolase extension form [Streptomyces sp. AK02-01A]MDX3850598.1 radical SAM/SPASM protein FxsB, inactivated metallohydrolase extension form [Streptomyces sp. AK02-01A]
MTGPLVPFREIVLKVHSRCDLACDHCYIYEHADQSWRTRPKTISDEAILWTALRLAEHAKTHDLPSVSVILHGGEPLLAGIARLRRVCEELTRALDGVAELDLRIHTNGLQLSTRHLDLFDEFDVKVGISLDGDRAANDRHRRFADGRSSHPLVLRAVGLLRQDRYRHLDLGLLCTVDAANDPVAVYDALAALDPPRIDFLLPHATWDAPPPRPDGSPTAYADWLLAVFDRWDERGRRMPVRLFESVLSTLSGGPSLTESLGLAPTDLVVVETDGTLEQADSLKSAYDGAAATGFDVFSHAFDEVAAHPGVRARQLGLGGVAETCRRCPVVRSCGGGLYTHRYRSAPGADGTTEGGFDNTSVYCADLEALIRGVESRTAAASTSPAVTDTGELLVAQQDLTRALLAGLHSELAGRGGEAWQEAWELAGVVEARSDGLDEVLAHPYTRTWLIDAVAALRQERPGALAAARGLSSYVAAAVVRGGLDLPVRVRWRDGALRLPTLGELRLGGPQESGEAEVRSAGNGFLVRTGTTERLVPRRGEATSHWRPVRGLVLAGSPALALDDLDPYRDCYGAPVHPGLGPDAAAEWSGRLAAAWRLLGAAVPEQASAAAESLSTLTPLLSAGPEVGGHGYGALGVPVRGGAEELARALLRGFRRARLRALTEVTDLYARDGEWSRPAPWREAPVPVSELLAGTYERVGLAAYDPAYRDHARRALDTLENAAELTVSGKSLLAALRKEADHG